MALDFPTSVSRGYINRTSNAFDGETISYAANQPFYFTCKFLIGWDGLDDKYFISLQNGDVDGNVFNYGIYQNRLLTWSGLYDTGTLTLVGVTRRLELFYNGTTLYVYLDGVLQNSRAVSIGAATRLRIGEYHNYATADSFIGEMWDWGFVLGTGTNEYIAPNGYIYLFNGSSWTPDGKEFSPNTLTSNLYKYRTIYTRGYVAGGYKSSTPWRNVNRTVHTTDITTNLGDLMDVAAAYTMSSYSDYNQFIYGAASGFPGTAMYTVSISMVNESGRTHNSSWDTSGSYGSYGDIGVILNPSLTSAWLTGSGYDQSRHNLVTEVMGAVGSGGTYQSDFNAAWQGEFYGFVKSTYSPGSVDIKMNFATETWSAAGTSVGTDGWGKALSTKDGHAYVKNGGNVVNTVHKVDDFSGSSINTGLTTPDGNAGEENYQTGQDHGYCLGHYNGVQNNNTYKVVHSTDTLTALGTDSQPKGHDGASSAGNGTASALVIGGL